MALVSTGLSAKDEINQLSDSTSMTSKSNEEIKFGSIEDANLTPSPAARRIAGAFKRCLNIDLTSEMLVKLDKILSSHKFSSCKNEHVNIEPSDPNILALVGMFLLVIAGYQA